MIMKYPCKQFLQQQKKTAIVDHLSKILPQFLDSDKHDPSQQQREE